MKVGIYFSHQAKLTQPVEPDTYRTSWHYVNQNVIVALSLTFGC